MDWKTRKEKLQDNGLTGDKTSGSHSNGTPAADSGAEDRFGLRAATANPAESPLEESTAGPTWDASPNFSMMADDEDEVAREAIVLDTPTIAPAGASVSLDAFAPYQPDPSQRPPVQEPPQQPAPAFQFQSIGQFSMPVEDVVTEPTSIFANPPQNGAAYVPPKMSGPISPTRSTPLEIDVDEPPVPYSSPERDSVASGLVSHDDEMGIPRVAPFIVDMPGAQAPEDETRSERVLILKVRNLSATYPLVNDVTTMGRPDAETQSYPDVEIELDDSVSRKHAEIRRKAVEFYLVDLGSTNGTMLNGQPLRPGIENQLKHGDRIRMGEKTELVFE